MLAVRAGHAFDGVRAMPRGALVLVHDGRIVGVEPGGAAAPEGWEVLDIPDGTVLPGLVDAHVHLCADGTDGTLERLDQPTEQELQAVVGDSLRRQLSAGVTTVRDLGDRHYVVPDHVSSASGVRPTVVAAGPPITSVGGHCALMAGEAAGREQLRDAVRQRVERGVDVVKVMASGGFATPGTTVMQCQFDLAELRVVVAEAHAAGLPVTAHAHGLPAVHLALDAAVDGIEHCSFLTDNGTVQSAQDLERLARAGTVVCPTLGFTQPPPASPAAVALMERLGLTFDRVQELGKARVGQMHAAGVRVVSGSDAGIAGAKPHGMLALSVAYLVQGGVSPLDALASATSLAADALMLGTRKGRLQAGYDADLLVVDGDATGDVTALARPVAVLVAGVRVPTVASPVTVGR